MAVKLPTNLKQFVSTGQLKAIVHFCNNSEESKYFYGKTKELSKTFDTMPKTYEQDGKGDDAIAYLHYFMGGFDWYITERDMETEQHQAFGLVNIGHGFELGYISLVELMANGVEVDFHFEPTTLREIKAGI